MINPAVFIGAPLSYKQFKIYPPKVKEVAANPFYSQYLRILTFSQEEIEDEFIEKKVDIEKMPTPFEFLLANCYNSKKVALLTKEAFKFFMKIDVEFFYEAKVIVVGNLKEILAESKSIDDLVLIKEEDFFDIQNSIREVSGEKKVEKPNPNEDPRVKKIKAKARYRDKIKAKQNKGISLSTCLTAICCMGIGITPLNIGEMSYAAVPAIMEMYQEKEKYHLDIDSLLAGADSKKIKPKYWIRNLD